ncbi:MAG: cytochrome P450, partial [Acidimicrobiia bacterium]|nr:cytochrome P450 [Acidimicrobiia bacterium]NNL27454.1 cytochrome P450 [Acidimicrobiia bacterium]
GLMQAEIDGDRLTPDEVIATSILTLNAGHEATVQAIGNGILALSRFPDQFEALRQTPGLIGTAVDELLRFDTPLQMFERWVLEDMEWKGLPLRRGTKVGLFLGSANHDDKVFEEPARLDLARNPNPHVALGGGIHYCVGAPLAKLELEVAFLEFSKHIREFTLATTDLDRVPSVVFRGVKALPISVVRS